jgi:transcriptional regulator with XRE-family HTH domain
MNQQKIGKYISKLRKEKGLTQQELAEKLGVSDRTVGNWENGRNMPDLSLFNPLCEILEISINDLMSGEKVKEEKYVSELERNIINTIEYNNKKSKNTILMIFLLILGFILIVVSNLPLLINNIINVLLFIIGIALVIFSLFKLLIAKTNTKIIISCIVAILLVIASLLFDYSITNNNSSRKPMWTYKTVKGSNYVLYKTPLYYYYVVNPTTLEFSSIGFGLNTYTIFDEDKNLLSDEELIPFNNKCTGIEHISKENSKDTYYLVNHLPICNQNTKYTLTGDKLTINYENSDWYLGSNEQYQKQLLIYSNSLIYYLRSDINEIIITTKEKEYHTTRLEYTNKYPNYNKIKDNKSFQEYVTYKLKDENFINKHFTLLLN